MGAGLDFAGELEDGDHFAFFDSGANWIDNHRQGIDPALWADAPSAVEIAVCDSVTAPEDTRAFFATRPAFST